MMNTVKVCFLLFYNCVNILYQDYERQVAKNKATEPQKKEVITMLKKTLGLVIAAIMLLGVFGLTACNGDLAQYKTDAKAAIQTYADAKGQVNYCTDSWMTICNAVTAGKAAVDAAKNKDKVDAAVATAKEINEVRKEGQGMFYTLQEAYGEGLLTMQDLQAIADFLNGGTASSTELSDEIIERIKEAAAIDMRNKEPALETKAEDFNILKYYGTYNESVAVILNDPYHEYPMEIVDIWIEVAGVSFHYVGHGTITIWTKNK